MGASYATQSPPMRLPEVTVKAPTEFLSEDISTLTYGDITDLQARDATTVFQNIPSVNVKNDGGKVSLSIRGSRASTTLVTLDGILLNNPALNNEADLFALDTQDLDTVAVITGPQALYEGAGAFGGVVHLTNRSPSQTPSLKISQEIGSDHYLDTRLSGSKMLLQGDKTSQTSSGAKVSLAHIQSGNGTLKDPYTQRSTSNWNRSSVAHLTLTHELSKTTELHLNIHASDSQTRLSRFLSPDVYVASRDKRLGLSNQIGVGVRFSTLNERWQHHLLISRLDLKTQFLQQDRYRVQGERQEINYTSKLDLRDLKHLDYGVSVCREESNPSNFKRISYSSQSLKARYKHGFYDGKLEPFVSARLDHHEKFNTRASYQGGISWHALEGLKLFVAAGTGYKAPTLSDFSGSAYSPPNMQLKPERTKLWEFGFETSTYNNRLKTRSVAFWGTIQDVISYNPITFQSINIHKRKTRGFEFSLALEMFDDLLLRTSITQNRVLDYTPKAHPARQIPKYITNTSLIYRGFAKSELFLELYTKSGLLGQTRSTNSVYFLRSGVRYVPVEHLALNMRIENALNQRREEFPGYGRRGIGVYCGLTWTL